MVGVELKKTERREFPFRADFATGRSEIEMKVRGASLVSCLVATT